MRATTKLLPLLGLAAVLLPVTPASAASTDAAIANFSFSPDPVTIAVGDSVKWTNTDNAGHTVTADNGSFGSPTLSPQGTFTQRFNQSGTIAYHCELHESMRGTVRVEGAATTTAPTTTTTAAPTTTTAAPTTTTTARLASPKPAVSSTTRATAAPTTTAAAPVTTTAPPPSSTAPPPAAATEETTATTQAALDMASDEGGSNGVGAVAGLAVLLLVLGGGTGWFALRRRSAGTGV